MKSFGRMIESITSPVTTLSLKRKKMKKTKMPNTDSIAELAEFWDTHDLTTFEDQLEEVSEPVFERERNIQIPLAATELQEIENLARAKGIDSVALIREWLLEKIHA